MSKIAKTVEFKCPFCPRGCKVTVEAAEPGLQAEFHLAHAAPACTEYLSYVENGDEVDFLKRAGQGGFDAPVIASDKRASGIEGFEGPVKAHEVALGEDGPGEEDEDEGDDDLDEIEDLRMQVAETKDELAALRTELAEVKRSLRGTTPPPADLAPPDTTKPENQIPVAQGG